MERWNWAERRHVAKFRGQGFASLDPGQWGCLLVFPAGAERPVRFANPMHVERCAQAMREFGASVMVIESQYVTNPKMARSIVELTLTMGILLGWVDHEFHHAGLGLHLFEVSPATWQAEQKRIHDPMAKREKGYGGQLSMRVAAKEFAEVNQWRTADPKFQTGIAAAWGIASWWKQLAWK
jgi:hypothetical protein